VAVAERSDATAKIAGASRTQTQPPKTEQRGFEKRSIYPFSELGRRKPMTTPITRNQVTTRLDETQTSGDEPTGGNSLLAQAAAFASVAREARNDCEKGKAAELALARRRNRSGQ
jgi:hypothetical protein